jgi:ketosteroid isomerase-like protein
MSSLRNFLVLAVLATVSVASAGNSSSVEQQLLAVEHGWGEALVRADIPALEKLYAPEYVFTNPFGAVSTREQDIANVKSGEFVVKSFEISDVKVQVYGNVGVMTGLNRSQASFKGMDASGDYRFTDVFVKRKGQWQCVASHLTIVAKQP